MGRIYSEYLRVIDKELALKMNPNQKEYSIKLHDARYFINLVHRVFEIATNGTVLRCGNNIGHLTSESKAYESDGSHTNLARAIVDYALDYVYGWGANSPTYTRREIDEAILLHDLPENETGDSPDNGDRNDQQKQAEENAYYDEFLALYDIGEAKPQQNIRKLLTEMQEKSTVEGRILYLADKVAAIIVMLCYDKQRLFPYARPGEKFVSAVNEAEMKLCDRKYKKGYLLSEVWTVDFLYARELTRLDDSGFFTALIVMATLKVRGKWYNWREEQYLP